MHLPAYPLIAVSLAADFGGKNPQNRNVCAGRPEATKADRTAEGPGTGNTGKPLSATAFTKLPPGSLIKGIPMCMQPIRTKNQA